MAEIDTISAKWATLSGTTTAEKLAEINALTVAGPNVDVQPTTVIGKLMLSGAYLTLGAFAQSSFTGDATHDAALGSAKMLMSLITTPNAPVFQMSDKDTHDGVIAMMDAILAQEKASPGSTGFTQAVHDLLVGLAHTTKPWIAATEAEGGAGWSTYPFSHIDAANAALV